MATQEVAQSVPYLSSQRAWLEFCENFELEPVVYFIGAPNGLVKIGFAKDLDVRFGQLVCGSPVPLRILAFAAGGRSEEGVYHDLFKKWRRHGEWFELCPEIEAEIARLNAPTPPSD